MGGKPTLCSHLMPSSLFFLPIFGAHSKWSRRPPFFLYSAETHTCPLCVLTVLSVIIALLNSSEVQIAPLKKTRQLSVKRTSQNLKRNSNRCSPLHPLPSAALPTVVISAVYHLLCAATNLTGVASVFPLLHLHSLNLVACMCVYAHNVALQASFDSAEAQRWKLQSFSHQRQLEWDWDFPGGDIVFPIGR